MPGVCYLSLITCSLLFMFITLTSSALLSHGYHQKLVILKFVFLIFNYFVLIETAMVVVYLFMFLKNFLYHPYPLPPPPPLELLPLSLSLNNFKLHLCLFYCPPSSPSIFDTLFTYFQSIDAGHFSNFIFVGDFNVNFDNPSHPLYSNLCNVMSLFSLSQSVVGPTHVQNNTSSTIDLVFVSNPSLVNECSTIPPLSNSDHLGILLDLKKKLKPSDKCQGRLIWRYSHADWEKACDLIDSFEWDSILTDDIDASLKQWHEQFMDIMAQSIPNRFLPPRRNLPWLTKPIIQSMRKRNMLFRKAKSSGNFTKYKRARNRTTNLLKLAKKRYFRSPNPKDSKKILESCQVFEQVKTIYSDIIS